MNKFICLWCGDGIVHPKEVVRKYCSRLCFSKAKSKKIRRKCLLCTDEFLSKPSSEQKYCSFKCYRIMLSDRQVKIFKCLNCQNLIPRSSGEQRKYCENCFLLLFRIDSRSIEELSSSNKDMQNRFNRIRLNAKYVMDRNCVLKSCLCCGYSRHVEICHIRAISDFPVDTKILVVNSLYNLMYLCPNCHWEFDNMVNTEKVLLLLSEKSNPKL